MNNPEKSVVLYWTCRSVFISTDQQIQFTSIKPFLQLFTGHQCFNLCVTKHVPQTITKDILLKIIDYMKGAIRRKRPRREMLWEVCWSSGSLGQGWVTAEDCVSSGSLQRDWREECDWTSLGSWSWIGRLPSLR